MIANIKKNGIKYSVCIFIIFFLVTLITHLVSDLVWSSAYRNTIITRDNVKEFCGSDMWSDVFDNFDYIETVKSTMLKTTVNYDLPYSPNIYIQSSDKADFIKKTKTVIDFINAYLNDNPECSLNRFESLNFEFSKTDSPNKIEFSNNFNGENLDGFDNIKIYSDDNDYLSIDDIVNFDTRFMLVDVPLDKSTDLSMLGSLKNVEELRLKADDKISEDIKTKIKNMCLDYKIILI